LNPRPHEAQLEEQKTKKSSKRSFRTRENRNANKRHKKQQTKPKWQRRARQAQNHKNSPGIKLLQTLSIQALSFRKSFIIFLLSTTLLAKSSINFVPIHSPFGNKFIKHKPKEKRDAIHEIQN
jgi:hypothetical protein